MNIFQSTIKLLKKNNELDVKIDSDRSNQPDKHGNNYNINEKVDNENVIVENSENESIFLDKEIIVGKFIFLT